MRQSLIGTLAFTALAGAVATGCGSSGGSTGPTGPTISAAQAQGAAAAAQSLGNSGLTVITSMSDLGASGLPALVSNAAGATPDAKGALAAALYAAGIRGRALGLVGAPPVFRSGSACMPTLAGALDSANAPLDTDGDGIPDSVTATYTNGNCTVYDSASATTFTFTGTFKLVDIGTVFGFRLLVDLHYTLTSPSESSHLTMTGSETFTVSSTVADLLVDLTTNDTVTASGHTISTQIQNQLHFVFTANQGSSIVLGSPIPDGTMDITGHVGTTLQGQPGSFSFDITTPTLLAYSAACDAANNNPPFTAGKIIGAFTGYATAGFSVTFTGCGVTPTVTTTGTT